MRIFRASLRKLVPRPASWVPIAVMGALLALIYLGVGATVNQVQEQPGGPDVRTLLSFPGAYDIVLSFILGLGGLLSLLYGAAIAGSEWSWGTLKTAVARGEGRVRYMTLTFASVAVLVGVGLVLTFLFGVVMAFVGAGLAGVSTRDAGDAVTIGSLPEKLLRGWLALTEQAALGFAIATIARSQLAGIGAGIAIFFGEQFAGFFLPNVVKYLPFHVADAVLAPTAAAGGGSALATRLDPPTALVLVVVWLVGSLAVAGAFTEQADIGG